jgi:hypothetical protein
LRELATLYREFAEWTGNPAIWEARLRTAAELEKEAARFDEASVRWPRTVHNAKHSAARKSKRESGNEFNR